MVYDTDQDLWIMIDWDTAKELEEKDMISDRWPPGPEYCSDQLREYTQFITDNLSNTNIFNKAKKIIGV